MHGKLGPVQRDAGEGCHRCPGLGRAEERGDDWRRCCACVGVQEVEAREMVQRCAGLLALVEEAREGIDGDSVPCALAFWGVVGIVASEELVDQGVHLGMGEFVAWATRGDAFGERLGPGVGFGVAV